MVLQELLLELSKNKSYYVETGSFDGHITIIVKEYWHHREELRTNFSLSEPIPQETIEKLKKFFI